MRTPSIVILGFAFVLGCGKSSNNGSDMSSSGGGGAGGLDMSAAMTGPCDFVAQSGCGTGQKCIPTFNGNNLTYACVPNGTVAEGQSCTPSNANANDINDNCLAGLVCDNDGPGSANICRKVCTADSACSTAGQKCGLVYTRQWGLCLPSCTEFGSDCGAGNDCSVPFDDITSTQQTPVGFFVCKKTGSVALYATCSQDSDCAAGLACDFNAGWCAQACDNTHPCTQPPATDGGNTSVSCQAYTNLTNGGGFCQ